MLKEEFINYVIKNGYQYTENSYEINVDKLIDDIGNIEPSISYYKKEGEIEICEEKDINNSTCSNRCYILNNTEIEIIKYFDRLAREDKQ